MHRRIIGVHLLNDLSGSPLVFRQALEQLRKEGSEIHLFTANTGDKGWLTDLDGIRHHPIFYRWHRSKLLTLIFFLFCQAILFARILRFSRRHDIVYINTLLPFGAALAARLRGASVVYHFHEVSVKPVLLKRFLLGIANACASKGIFVSRHLSLAIPFKQPAEVIYNALSPEFESRAARGRKKNFRPFNVLMICSLRDYKGVKEFMTLADRLPGLGFTLVLNASPENMRRYLDGHRIPPNLELHGATPNVHPYYEKASVVMNLSRPDQWVETFGMTVLEGMHYGKPVIVPTVGGITELVEDGHEGYRASSRDLDSVQEALLSIWENAENYERMSRNAVEKARSFSSEAFSGRIIRLFQEMDHPAQAKPVRKQQNRFSKTRTGFFHPVEISERPDR